MQKTLFRALAMLPLFVAPAALAADLSPLETDKYQDVSVYDWSGFYLGVQGGYGWADTETSLQNLEFDLEGGFIGGFVGYNYQVGNFVFGVEGEYSAADIEDTDTIGLFVSSTTELDSFGSITGKLGFAYDRVLFYGFGGVSFAEISASQKSIPGGFLVLTPGGGEEDYTGYTVGAGFDYAVAQNLIVGLKYQYYDFGSEDFDASGTAFGARTIELDMHTVSARIGYKF